MLCYVIFLNYKKHSQREIISKMNASTNVVFVKIECEKLQVWNGRRL